MPRVNCGPQSHRRHKKIIKMAKGYRGRSKNCFRIAIQKVEKGLQYAYRDRKCKKRTFRTLWIQRINAATRSYELAYSQFMKGISILNLNLNRKALSEIAYHHPKTFRSIVDSVKSVLSLHNKANTVASPELQDHKSA